MLKSILVAGAMGTLAALQTCQADSKADPMAVEQGFSAQLLTAHNQYRSQVDVPSLSWSDTLANDAQQWADRLAASGGQLMHAELDNQGENLWAGTADAYTLTDMVNGWGEEKENFVTGTFPNVSTTGNWSDVGHYTQMIWRDTEQVGCAIATGGGNDVLVCRYSPAGNVRGQSVY